MSDEMVQLASFGGEVDFGAAVFTTTTSTTKASSSKAAKPGVMSDSKSGKASIVPSAAPSVSVMPSVSAEPSGSPSVSLQPSISTKPSVGGKGGKMDSKSGKSLR
jgi:hypothetical protein